MDDNPLEVFGLILASGECQCHSLLFIYSVIVDNVGSPRVTGDDEEDDTDDLENEFNYNDVDKTDSKQIIEEMLHNHMSYGRDGDVVVTPMQPQYPLLTNGHLVRRLLFACTHNKTPNERHDFNFETESQETMHIHWISKKLIRNEHKD